MTSRLGTGKLLAFFYSASVGVLHCLDGEPMPNTALFRGLSMPEGFFAVSKYFVISMTAYVYHVQESSEIVRVRLLPELAGRDGGPGARLPVTRHRHSRQCVQGQSVTRTTTFR